MCGQPYDDGVEVRPKYGFDYVVGDSFGCGLRLWSYRRLAKVLVREEPLVVGGVQCDGIDRNLLDALLLCGEVVVEILQSRPSLPLVVLLVVHN